MSTDTRGTPHSRGPSLQQIYDGDTIQPPEPLRLQSYEWLGGEVSVPVSRYTSREFHELEQQRLWPHVWQMACRDEDIPQVGDHIVYDIGDLSFIVVRCAPDEVRAYRNACLHRGRALADEAGHADFFRCAFHGFAWSLDGTFRGMPARWDFPHAVPEDLCLPRAQVAHWQGFILINPDLAAEPFETFAAPLIDHFAHFPIIDRYKAHHICQVIDANWKVGMEAFMEGYHLLVTHPQLQPYSADYNIQYDWFGPNVSRLMEAVGVPGDALIGELSEADIVAAMQPDVPPDRRSKVGEGQRARTVMAQHYRKVLSRLRRIDLSAAPDSLLLDSIQYFLFPNFFPWAGYGNPLVYRFRPWADDPGKSLLEVMLLHPRPDDGEFSIGEPFWLAPDQSWGEAPGFEFFGPVFDQDISNLKYMQKGLRATAADNVLLADYQEVRIQHFHRTLSRQLDLAVDSP